MDDLIGATYQGPDGTCEVVGVSYLHPETHVVVRDSWGCTRSVLAQYVRRFLEEQGRWHRAN